MVNLVIQISEGLMDYLQKQALRERKAVEDVAIELLEQHIPEYDMNRDPLLMIAKAADEAGLSSLHGDLSMRSREILENDFPDDLTRSLEEQPDREK